MDNLVERLNAEAERLDNGRIFATAELLFEAAAALQQAEDERDKAVGALREATVWRSMETAPRLPAEGAEKVDVLAYWPGGYIESAYWSNGWWPTAYDAEAPWEEPTGWLPLPKSED